MKNKNIVKFFAALLIMGSVQAVAPIEVVAPINHVFSPFGFDSNDNSQVIISGYLPNLCYKAPRSIVKIHDNKVDIKVVSLKYNAENTNCAEMIVPFVQAVDLGVMDKGNYDVVINGNSEYEHRTTLGVSRASSDAVDDFVYADVEYVDKNVGGKRTIVLKGYNPSDCFVLDKIDIEDNNKDVYSIEPKMKQISEFCPEKMVPFEYEMQVPEKLKADQVLLHVRSIKGRSVNSIFDNSIVR